MSILEDCRNLHSLIIQSYERSTEASSKINNLQYSELYEISIKVQDVTEMCGEVLTTLSEILVLGNSIQSMTGIFNFLSSTSLISTVVVPLIRTGYDESVIYNNDLVQRTTDLKENPVSPYYKKPPVKKVLGDLGELVVLKMLIDPEGEDNLEISGIEIKTSLLSKFNNKIQNPDFYIPSRNLVIDAKAWRKFSRNNLEKVVEKYTDLVCLDKGGEIRFYFPIDTYQEYESIVRGIRVRTVPMSATYSDLTWQRELMFLYLKTLMLHNAKNKKSFIYE